MSDVTKCTWEGCGNEARAPQIAGDGSVWANLCDEHSKQLEDAIDALDVEKILSSWVKAQGGSAQAARKRESDK